jgi:hypothetical protein
MSMPEGALLIDVDMPQSIADRIRNSAVTYAPGIEFRTIDGRSPGAQVKAARVEANGGGEHIIASIRFGDGRLTTCECGWTCTGRSDESMGVAFNAHARTLRNVPFVRLDPVVVAPKRPPCAVCGVGVRMVAKSGRVYRDCKACSKALQQRRAEARRAAES